MASVAVAVLIGGCGGSARNGNGSEPSPSTAGNPGDSAGGASPLQSGDSNDAACVGSLDDASNAFGIPLPGGGVRGDRLGRNVQLTPSERTERHRAHVPVDLQPEDDHDQRLRDTRQGLSLRDPAGLVEWWRRPATHGCGGLGDTKQFCGGMFKRITAGKAPLDCMPSEPKLLCQAGAPSSEPHPDACFDPFDSSCAPCCAAEPLDCTGKADGYPGDSCIPSETPLHICSCWQGS
jgi:hypothetical protein